MAEPRCGRSDLYNVRTSDVVPWKNQTITYSVSTNSTLFAHEDLKLTIRRVFDVWSSNIPRKFQEVDNELLADIKVRFGKREHGDGAPFDGPGGILAHAFIKGLLHFDDDEIWKKYSASEQIIDGTKDIFWVALHEAGHVLGLDHTKVFDSVMQPSYVASIDSNGNYIEPSLISTDIEDIQEIYGGKTKPKSKFLQE
uniref:Peptidase metallopeptidase domain-containing protein n=1 Tax=Panagrolaimus davidi TaxID=227884 RepID=A0A914P6F0_9BILA